MNAIWLATAMLAAAAPAPPRPECRPVVGPSLEAGCWGLVRVKVINNSSRPAEVLLVQRSGEFAQSVSSGAKLKARRQGEYLLPFRPLSARLPLSVEIDGQRIIFGEEGGAPGSAPLVLPAGVSRVVEVRAGAGEPLPLRGVLRAEQGRMHPDHLPEWAAIYEGIDLLIISELPAGGLALARRKALSDWFRAGGRVVVTSEKVLQDLSAELLGSGSAARKVLVAGRSAVTEFRCGFGRGLLVLPGKGGVAPDWSDAAWAISADRPAPIAPLVCAKLYHRGDDLPGLRNALVGASDALRWGLIVAVAILAAGLVFWRRGKSRRFSLAVAGAGLGAALAVAFLDPAPELRALRLRVEEHSADGAGLRAREYLYLEKVNPRGAPAAEVRAAPGVLPSPILYSAGEARVISLRTPRPVRAEKSVSRLSFESPSLFLGAGPLPGGAPLKSPPAGATRLRRIDGLREGEAVAAIADCLADRGGARRPQAEFLARFLWDAVAPRTGAARVTVCRLPGARAALAVEGRGCRTADLGRVGIFYGAKE